MDVVAVVLRVVVLDEEGGPLHAIVVLRAPGDRASPGEREAVETGGGEPAHALGSQVVGDERHVARDQRHQRRLLRRGHARAGQAARSQWTDVVLVERDDVSGRRVGDDRGGALRLSEQFHQGPARVLERRQHPQPLRRPSLDLGGIRASEGRRGGRHAAIRHREVQRQVMPLHPPAPGRAPARRAEHGELVVEGRTGKALTVLERAQGVFELDDRRGGEVALVAEAGLEQGVRLGLLIGRHGAERHALAREHLVGDEVPAVALIGGVVEHRDGALLGPERGHERLRSRSHRGGRSLRSHDDGQLSQEQNSQRHARANNHGRPHHASKVI